MDALHLCACDAAAGPDAWAVEPALGGHVGGGQHSLLPARQGNLLSQLKFLTIFLNGVAEQSFHSRAHRTAELPNQTTTHHPTTQSEQISHLGKVPFDLSLRLNHPHGDYPVKTIYTYTADSNAEAEGGEDDHRRHTNGVCVSTNK